MCLSNSSNHRSPWWDLWLWPTKTFTGLSGWFDSHVTTSHIFIQTSITAKNWWLGRYELNSSPTQLVSKGNFTKFLTEMWLKLRQNLRRCWADVQRKENLTVYRCETKRLFSSGQLLKTKVIVVVQSAVFWAEQAENARDINCAVWEALNNYWRKWERMLSLKPIWLFKHFLHDIVWMLSNDFTLPKLKL